MSYQHGTTTTNPHSLTTTQEQQTLAEEGKQQLRKASEQISQTLSQQASEAKVRLKASADSQKSEVVHQMASVNDALRKTASNLDHPRLEQSLEKLAGKIETAADRLAEAEIGEVADAAGRLARENSTVFALASFALGLSVARFMKATPNPIASTQESAARAAASQQTHLIPEGLPHEAR